MLPAPHRLRRSGDFSAVMRAGQRSGRDTLVVHVGPPRSGTAGSGVDQPAGPVVSRFGLVVGRTVGNSVVRHRVSRRLRALLAARVDRVPAGVDVVVRARPRAATADSTRLAADLDSALATVARRLARTNAVGARS